MSDQFEDLKNIKSMLSTMPSNQNHLILFGASLEALRDLKLKTDTIHEKLSSLEAKLVDMEKSPKRQPVNVTRIIQQSAQPDAMPPQRDPLKDQHIRPDFPLKQMAEAVQEPQQILFVTDKRRESIQTALHQHGRLSSSQLSRIIGLSRTRANEYLKEMEREGQVVATLEEKKKFYSLVNQ